MCLCLVYLCHTFVYWGYPLSYAPGPTLCLLPVPHGGDTLSEIANIRNKKYRLAKVTPEHQIKIGGANLTGANLVGADMCETNLKGVRWQDSVKDV